MEAQSHNASGKALFNSFIFKFITVIGPLILVPLFVKYLTIEEYGIWLIVISISSYFFLTNPGITQVVSNAVAREEDKSKVDYFSKVASSGYYLFKKITNTILILSLIVFIIISYIYDIEIFQIDPVTMPLPLTICIVSILTTFPLIIYRSVLQGLNLIHIEQFYNIIFGSLFRYAITIIALISGFKLIALAIIYAVSNFLPSLGARHHLSKAMPDFKISKSRIDQDTSREMMEPTISFLMLLLSQSLLASIGTIIIGIILGPSSVPMYAVPMQIMILVYSTLVLVHTIKMPVMALLYKKKRIIELQELFKVILFFTFLGATFVILNLYFFGEAIFISWAGTEIFPGNDIFNLMLIFTLIYIFTGPLDSLLQATENHSNYAKMNILEAILNVLLTIFLTKEYGLKGTISAVIFSRLLTNGWFMIKESMRVLDYKLSDLSLWLLKNIIIPLLLLLGILFFLIKSSIFSDGSIIIQIIILNIFLVSYFALISKNNIIILYKQYFRG